MRQNGSADRTLAGLSAAGSTDRESGKIVLTRKSRTMGTPVLYNDTSGLRASPPNRRFWGSYTTSCASWTP